MIITNKYISNLECAIRQLGYDKVHIRVVADDKTLEIFGELEGKQVSAGAEGSGFIEIGQELVDAFAEGTSKKVDFVEMCIKSTLVDTRNRRLS